MNHTAGSRRIIRHEPFMVSRKLPHEATTGIIMPMPVAIAVVCSHHGSGENTKWWAPISG